MEEIKLDVSTRNQLGTRKVKSLRRQDFIPAIVYGETKEATPIKVGRKEYESIMRHHRGQSLVFRLNVKDGDKKLRDYSVIVREEQNDPVSDRLLHIDFNRISLTKEIEVKVAISHKGDPIGVKQDGGSLDQHLWELDIICLPLSIPEKIQIDVTHLKIGDSIHVKEIKLPQGVRTNHDLEAIVVTVVPPMKEKTAEEAAAPLPEVEVTKEKKKDEAAPKADDKADKKAEAKPEKK